MQTNKEYLYSLDPHALTEWFESEHGSNDAPSLKGLSDDTQNVTDNRETDETCNKSGEIVTDSREKLEADVREWVDNIGWLSDKETQVADFIAWLDRQAAITEREHPGLTISDDESLINWHGKNYLMQSRALNAERERDEFSLKLNHEMELNRDNRNALDLERIAELQAQVDELKHERDYWKLHADMWAEKCEGLRESLGSANEAGEKLQFQVERQDALISDILDVIADYHDEGLA